MREKQFHRGAESVSFGYAKEMRKLPTKAEKILWQELRGDKLFELRFRRQHPVGKYILDFFCHQINLGIEADGEYHLTPEQDDYDKGRTYELQQMGITLLRFTNHQIETQLPQVMATIKAQVEILLRAQSK